MNPEIKHEQNVAFVKFIVLIVLGMVTLLVVWHFGFVQTAWQTTVFLFWMDLPRWMKVCAMLSVLLARWCCTIPRAKP